MLHGRRSVYAESVSKKKPYNEYIIIIIRTVPPDGKVIYRFTRCNNAVIIVRQLVRWI